MNIRFAKSCAGPHGSFRKGEVRRVGPEIDKKLALEFLNAGIAIAEADVGVETAEFPVHTGGGWYRLSSGEKVQGKDDAIRAEREL